jgi:para-aminobenzoate synthetase component 1
MSPGGSISGCPKKRACEIIHELEPLARGIYTGTIGYILPNGTLNFNIAIRTILQQGKDLTLGVGGGITIDSNIEDEYNETLVKAASLQPNI